MEIRTSHCFSARAMVLAILTAFVFVLATIWVIDASAEGEPVERPLMVIAASAVAVLAVYSYSIHGWNIKAWIGLDDDSRYIRRR